ncbi:MAG: type II toxin-antitoxin system RelE/ParE family toxin [Candidatus Obscuribacterales bacterium]|nr:type II toxin-antitoxin system RelE/ParE family toxin [Candidatus Obscuribacterales bacterium]
MTKKHKLNSTIRIDPQEEKEVIWYPDNLKEEIRKNWPTEMKKEIGFQLGRVQQGLDPDHFREMPSIGAGVREIKIQDENKSQYRLIYVAKFQEGIYAFHVITKKTTEQTEKSDIKIASKRYKEIIENRTKRTET